MHQHQA